MTTNLKFCDSIKSIISSVSEIDTDSLLVIIDVNVSLLYKDELSALTQNSGKRVLIYKAISGESLKCIREFEKCLNYFLESGVHRKSHLVCIGGGVTSDFAGFVASSLLRGISWTVVPTTLLSMVDAAIGGKTGLNVECGKNLVGAFHLPQTVLTCHKFLRTLDETQLQSGKGEILKYAFLEPSIGEYLLENNFDFTQLVNRCAKYKLELTQKDYKELGLRKILNLGHTIGHAIEKHYLLSHGISVFFGMITMFIIHDDHSSLEKLSEYSKAINLGDYEIPWHNRTFPTEDIFLYMTKDKKMNSNSTLDIILVESQKATFKKVELLDLKKLVENKNDELKKFVL